MANTIADEVDAQGFEAKLAACSDSLKGVVAYLRASAQHAGVRVAFRRFRHADPNSGWGVTYYIGAASFCEIHPKAQDEHAWIRLGGTDLRAVESSGFESSKQPGWFKIRTMEEAVRFVPWILQAHDAAAATVASG